MASDARNFSIIDPAWQGWAGILIIVSVVFLLPFGCGTSAPAPAVPTNPLAAKLPELEKALATTKKRSEQLLTAREAMETQRVALLEKLRKHGVTPETKADELSEAAKIDRDEFIKVVKDMQAMKSRHDENEVAVAKIESTIRQLKRKLEIDDALLTPEDQKQLEDANVLLLDVDDRLNPESKKDDPLDAISADDILKEQLGAKKE